MKIIERVKYGARGQGSLIRREGSANWLFAYCHHGKEHEESTGKPDLKKAKYWVKDKLEKIGKANQEGRSLLSPLAQRVRVSALLDDLEADYRLRKVKSWGQIQSHMKSIRERFGDDRAADMTASPSTIDAYIEARLEDDVAPATINRGTQLLAQAFRLGVKHGRVTAVPWIRHLPEDNTRQGFFEVAEFAALVAALSEDLRDVVRFGYLTGWRSGEIKALRWQWVDREGGLIRLPGVNAKNGHARKVPIEGELRYVMRRREQARLVESDGEPRIADLVFHRDGQPIVERACPRP